MNSQKKSANTKISALRDHKKLEETLVANNIQNFNEVFSVMLLSKQTNGQLNSSQLLKTQRSFHAYSKWIVTIRNQTWIFVFKLKEYHAKQNIFFQIPQVVFKLSQFGFSATRGRFCSRVLKMVL